jgi:hypothetical protein
MPTANECQYNAEICIKLANEPSVKNALIDLADEFRAMATLALLRT